MSLKDMSLQDSTELRELILSNPTLPLVTFVSEDTNNGDYGYMHGFVTSVSVNELTLYNDELWLDYDDVEEELRDDLCDDCIGMTDEEFDKEVKRQLDEMEFTKCIVVMIG